VPQQAFMHSGRGRAGKPESSFFWRTIAGRPCIAKVLTTEQGPHLLDFVKNEQQVLRFLQEKKAPVCQLVDFPDHPEWLVTEFGGLSLDLLGGRSSAGWPSLPIEEYVSVWAHFLYRAQSLADLGAVPLDLAGRNLVVPIGSNGQLKLNEALSIDHAHTVLPSPQLPEGALKRPMWIDALQNPYLAPELRAALQRDQKKLMEHLEQNGVPRPDSTAGLAQGPSGLSAKTWLEYSAPQEIQTLVNKGAVQAEKVIQFAVGHDIHRRLRADNPLTPGLASVVQRLCAEDPAKRYEKLAHAADALRFALNGQLAMASAYTYCPNLPQDLVPKSSAQATLPLIDLHQFAPATGPASPATGDGSTILVRPNAHGGPAPNQTKDSGEGATISPKPPHSPIQRWLWPLLAAALAVVIGIPLGTSLVTWLAAP